MDNEFKKILSLNELIDKYGVRIGFASVESSLVYPEHKDYEWVGVVNDEFVNSILQSIIPILKNEGQYANVFHINNKYAIPFVQTANGLGKTTTWFLYQHDNNTWIIKSK